MTNIKEARYCLLCGDEGEILYKGQRDRLFGVPGIWTLMQCPGCQLVWLNPQPTPDDIGKLYEGFEKLINRNVYILLIS